MTSTTTRLFPILVLTGVLLAPVASAQPEIVYEFSLIPGEDGQPEFGFPFHAAASPDGRHLYVDTFPPGPALLTFERDGQTLVLRDSLDLLEAGIDSTTDLKITADGRYLLLGEFSPAAVHVFERDAESGLLTRVQILDPELDIVLDGLDAEDPGLVWGRRQFPEEGSMVIPLDRTAGAAREVSSSEAVVVDRQEEMPFELATATSYLTGVKYAERLEFPGDSGFVVIDQQGVHVVQDASAGTVDDLPLEDLGIDAADIARVVTGFDERSGIYVKILTHDGRVIMPLWGQSGFTKAYFALLPGAVTQLRAAEDIETFFVRPEASVLVEETDIVLHTLVSQEVEELLGVHVSAPYQGVAATEDLVAHLEMEDLEVSTFPIAVPERVPLGQMEFAVTADGTSIYGAQTNPPAIHVLRYERGEVAFCVPGETTACLSGFAATVDWEDHQGNTGQASVVPGGTSNSSLFWFFSPDNWEMLLKVLDGCALNGHHWVFFAAATNVGFDVEVSDPEVGTASYSNPVGVLAPAVTDTGAIPCSEGQVAAAEARLARDPAGAMAELATALGEIDAWVRENRSSLATRPLGSAPLGDGLTSTRSLAARHGCEDTATAICLDGRFLVEVAWRDFEGATGSGTVAPLSSADSGLFWFFSADNWELLVKVLDGCGLNERYWVLGAATTNVEYTLTITDTETGAVWTHTNPLGVSSPAIADTSAFAGCP